MKHSSHPAVTSPFGEEPQHPADRHRCVGCRAPSPPTATAHTLISKTHGWRVVRVSSSSGFGAVEWRCPECWSAHKKARETK